MIQKVFKMKRTQEFGLLVNLDIYVDTSYNKPYLFYHKMAETLQFLSKTVNAWDTISDNHKIIMLIGNSYTGRSTFAQLINKYQYKVESQDLKFQKDKYSREGVISTKSIKLQTTLPNIYKQQAGEEDGISIIDVPSYCLTPETKKWTPYQQKLTITLMSQKKESIGFLLFIEQKNTRSNISSWTKTLFSFLDMFKQLPNELLNSIGWVITKCGPEITEDSISKRLRQMQATIKKQKNIETDVVDKIFDNIVENQKYFIFRKCTGNEKEEEQIKNIYKQIGKIANYHFDKQNLKEINWTQEQVSTFKQYFEECDNDLATEVSFVYKCLSLPKWENESFLKNRPAYSKRFPQTQSSSRSIQSRFDSKSNKFQVSSLIQAVSELASFLKDGIENKTENELVRLIINFPFFINNQHTVGFFQRIWEAINFKSYTKVEFEFKKSLELLNQFNQRAVSLLSDRLAEIKDQNDNQAFYQACIKLLQNASELKQKDKRFLDECKSSILKFRNSKQLLTKIAKDLQSIKDQKKICDALSKIANAYQKQGYLSQAAKLFRLILCPGNAIFCLEKIQNETEKDAEQLIKYLVQVYLFDSAKKFCYMKAAKFQKSRTLFGKLLNYAIEAQTKFLQSSSRSNLLLQEPVIAAEAVKAISKEAAQIAQKIQG